MKKILAILLILCSFVFGKGYDAAAVDKHYKRLTELSPKQKEVLFATYTKGKKQGFKEISAIAWNESNLGEVMINPKDGKYGSHGTYHALMDTVLARYKLKPSKHNITVIGDRLRTDFEFSSNEVIAELKYWKQRYRNDPNQYDKMLASYNAGTKGLNSTFGVAYKNVTKNRMLAIERYIKNNQKAYIAYLDKHKPTTYIAKTETVKTIETPKPFTKPLIANVFGVKNQVLFLKPTVVT